MATESVFFQQYIYESLKPHTPRPPTSPRCNDLWRCYGKMCRFFAVYSFHCVSALLTTTQNSISGFFGTRVIRHRKMGYCLRMSHKIIFFFKKYISSITNNILLGGSRWDSSIKKAWDTIFNMQTNIKPTTTWDPVRFLRLRKERQCVNSQVFIKSFNINCKESMLLFFEVILQILIKMSDFSFSVESQSRRETQAPMLTSSFTYSSSEISLSFSLKRNDAGVPVVAQW